MLLKKKGKKHQCSHNMVHIKKISISSSSYSHYTYSDKIPRCLNGLFTFYSEKSFFAVFSNVTHF